MNDGVAIAVPGADKPAKPGDIIKEKTGIELNFTQALADTIVTQYITNLGEDVLKNTFEAMNEEYINDRFNDPKKFQFNLKKYTDGWNSRVEYTKLGDTINRLIADTYGNAIVDFVKEYMETDDFKARLKQMADEVVDYALEGYKKDMINRLRERLVGNAFATSLWEEGTPIDAKIEGTVRETMRQHMDSEHYRNGY